MTLEVFFDKYLSGYLRLKLALQQAGLETVEDLQQFREDHLYKNFTQVGLGKASSNKIVLALERFEEDAIYWAAAQVATLES